MLFTPILFLLLSSLSMAPADNHSILLWPHGAPNQKIPNNQASFGAEHDTAKPTDSLVGGRSVAKITDVSVPTITFYPAPTGKDGSPTVVVFPGGGYRILALDLEGTEICHWLNSIGVNAVLLKYRVPQRPDLPRYAPPLQDAQRAMGLVRSHAGEWHLNPQRIGVIGFSAGGHLAALLSNVSSENNQKRSYQTVDMADNESCRPDFTLLIYPAYLTAKDEGKQLAPEFHVSSHTPATFLVQTEDDPVHVENSLVYYRALKDAGVPAEMHIYSKGRHGYGSRPTDLPVTHWPDLAQTWLRTVGVLNKEQ